MYKYVYEIRTNNLCYGCKLLDVCDSLKSARIKILQYENKFGVCDIYIKRKYI